MSIISTVPKGAAVEGINPNLLRNWYFVGGGTGRGVFPVNSRGQTSYPKNAYNIDGWFLNNTNNFGASLTNDALELTSASYTGAFVQFVDNIQLGQEYTLSVMFSSGFIIATSGKLNNQSDIIRTGFSTGALVLAIDQFQVQCFGGNTLPIKAVKLELGSEQTLAHQENGVWVLNEIPDYETEYYKCVTSDADSSDTYANQKVSNITVQCNSVGSSSLRYYNKLIQSTHKVLDSTFSNPAAQTSDITVTTYDGYLDFSNGFASGATTNITLVLGTSGPVLSTSTTAPS